VFHPVAAGSPLSAKYGGWLRKFAASVCWRILEERVVVDGLAGLSGRWSAEAASCRAVWRDYLLGRRPDVGGHHLHLMRVHPLTWSGVASSPPAIRGVVACVDQSVCVTADLGPFVLAGLVTDHDLRLSPGSRINAEGKLKARESDIPTANRGDPWWRPPPAS